MLHVGHLNLKKVITPLAHGRGIGGEAHAAELSQEHLDEGLPVVELEALALDIVLAELHLQEVVVQRHASLDRRLHIVADSAEQGVHGIKGASFLVHGDELPIILLDLCLYIFLRELQLQLTNFLAEACELVAKDDLSACEEGLHSCDACQRALLHHLDGHRRRECHEGFGRQHLCQRSAQLGRDILRGVDFHLSHRTVGLEAQRRAADRGEIVGEGLLALLLSGFDVEATLAQGDVVVQGRVFEGLEGKGRLSCDEAAASRTKEDGYDLFHQVFSISYLISNTVLAGR